MTADSDLKVSGTSTFVFGPDDWDSFKSVAVAAGEDSDGANGTALFTHTPSGGHFGSTAATVTVAELDNDAAMLLSTSSLVVPEGTTLSYGVKLAAAPGGVVRVVPSRFDPDGTFSDTSFSVDTATLTFTTGNWSIYQSVAITAATDTDITDGTAFIKHTVRSGDYNVNPATVTLTATEDDSGAAGFLFDPPSVVNDSLTVTEQGSAVTYTVRLKIAPSADTTVAVTRHAGDTNVAVTPANLIFATAGNNIWSTPQTVTVSVTDDVDMEDGSATIRHAVTTGGTDYNNLSRDFDVAVIDDDEPGLTFSTSSLSVPEGGTATYDVQLATKPTASVTLAIAPSGPSAEIDVTVTDGASLTFTTDNWSDNQPVELSAAEDDDSANGTEAIIHEASNGGYGGVVATLTVTEADNDPLGFVFAQSDGTALSSLSVPESGTAVYQVKLASQPSASTAVTVQAFGGSTDDSDCLWSGRSCRARWSWRFW